MQYYINMKTKTQNKETSTLNSTEVIMDLQIQPFTFQDTEITISAVSSKAKTLFTEMFGFGAASINLPKSRATDFVTFAERKGLKVQ